MVPTSNKKNGLTEAELKKAQKQFPELFPSKKAEAAYQKNLRTVLKGLRRGG